MTRDEILNMPAGREMDALVAEYVMGYPKPIYIHPGGHMTRIEGDGWYCQPIFEHGDICEWYPYSYSTEISAAWEVVEKVGLSIIPTPNGYFVGIYDDEYEYFDTLTGVIDGHFGGGYSGRKDIYNEDSQATLAICRAALLATLEID